jgi:hypothetical protein
VPQPLPLEYVEDRAARLVFRWRTVALSHIIELTDIEPKKNGAKRGR